MGCGLRLMYGKGRKNTCRKWFFGNMGMRVRTNSRRLFDVVLVLRLRKGLLLLSLFLFWECRLPCLWTRDPWKWVGILCMLHRMILLRS